MRRRKGFTLIETIATASMLALIVITVVTSSLSIAAMRKATKDTVYLSIHNLNQMERLRQIAISEEEGLLDFYSNDVLGSLTVETTAEVSRTAWDHFTVYHVTLKSKMKDSGARLTSEYVVTDIGGTVLSDES